MTVIVYQKIPTQHFPQSAFLNQTFNYPQESVKRIKEKGERPIETFAECLESEGL